MVSPGSRSHPSIPQPKALQGFEHINRYWDRRHGVYAAKILPGEYYVTTTGEMITTVLGSCVSACIRDRDFGVGGMNHFMLPDHVEGDEDTWIGTHVNAATRYGNYAMEHLVNDILSHGGRRTHLEIKIFGGGRMLDLTLDVGRRNIEFVRSYVEAEGFALVAEEVGDIYPRKVVYYPDSGRVLMKKLRQRHNDTVIKRERSYLDILEHTPVAGSVDLF